MTNKDLADLLYPNITKTIEDLEIMYPKRDLNLLLQSRLPVYAS